MGIRWRRLFASLVALFLEGSAVLGQGSQRIYIVEEAGQLCGYTRRDDMNRAEKERDPEYVVIAELRGAQLTAIRLRRSTEDTATFDEYTVLSDRSLTRLKRTLDVVPERITRMQVWDLRRRDPVKVSESWMEFQSHKPIQPNGRLDDIIDHAVITHLRDFPFYTLVTDSHPETWVKGRRCIAGDMGKLEAAMHK